MGSQKTDEGLKRSPLGLFGFLFISNTPPYSQSKKEIKIEVWSMEELCWNYVQEAYQNAPE